MGDRMRNAIVFCRARTFARDLQPGRRDDVAGRKSPSLRARKTGRSIYAG